MAATPAQAAAATTPPLRATAAAPPALGAYTVRPGDTLSGLAAGARVPLNAMAAMNGLDPSKVLLAGTVIKLPAGAPAPARASQPAPAATVVPQAGPSPRRRASAPATIQSAAAANGVAGLARRRDRLAGERVQQRDGVGRQRARRDADHAGHVGLRAGQPRRWPAARSELGHRQRERGRALPQEPAAADGRQRVRRDRLLLPGLGSSSRAACCRHPAVRGQRAGAARPLRRLARSHGGPPGRRRTCQSVRRSGTPSRLPPGRSSGRPGEAGRQAGVATLRRVVRRGLGFSPGSITPWLTAYNKFSGMNNVRSGTSTVGQFFHSTWAKTQAKVPVPWEKPGDGSGITRALTDLQGSVSDYSNTENLINNEFQFLVNKEFKDFTLKSIVGINGYMRTTKECKYKLKFHCGSQFIQRKQPSR